MYIYIYINIYRCIYIHIYSRVATMLRTPPRAYVPRAHRAFFLSLSLSLFLSLSLSLSLSVLFAPDLYLSLSAPCPPVYVMTYTGVCFTIVKQTRGVAR